MKIGILTFHEGINHGAFFQAYATFSYLKEAGFDVEVINYKNKKHFFLEYKAFFWTKHPVNLYKNIAKIFLFKKAHKKFKLTNFSTNIGDIDTSKYDVIVVGSDIVWDYEWDFIGSDPVYFGHGLHAKKLVSYAPSIGKVDLSNVIPEFVQEGLKKFDNISVRDESTALLVKNILGEDPEMVVDPAFIYDISGQEIDHDEKVDYMLVYAYHLRDKEIQSAISYARRHNLKLISIGYFNPWCDKNITNIGPFEWLGYFKNAKTVLTGTFHGTIFSIKYARNFVTCANLHIKPKLKTILGKIGLTSRMIENGDIAKVLNTEIDYSLVNKKLILLIGSSRKYLLKAIND